MTDTRFTFTDRCRPILEIGVGDTRIGIGLGRWDVSRWDAATATWAGDEPTWLDSGCEVQRAEFQYGRAATTDRFVPGTATILVTNASGWADPLATDDPAILSMRPGRAIRLGVEHVTLGRRWLFRGVIDAMRPTYLPDRRLNTVQLDCVDALGDVNRAKFIPLDNPVGLGDFATVRVSNILDRALWPPTKRRLEASSVELIGTNYGGQSADLLGVVAESVGGAIFGDMNGDIVFRNRDWQAFVAGSPPDGTIGNVDPGTPGYWEPGIPAVPGYLNATVGTVSTADTPDMAIDGSFRVAAKLRTPNWTPNQNVAGQWEGFGGDLSWTWWMVSNQAVLARTLDGTTTVQPTTPAIPGLVADTDTWLRLVVRATPSRVAVERSTDQGATWTEVAVVASPGPNWSTLFNANGPLRVGARNNATGARWQGRIYWAQMEAINRAQLVFPGVAGNLLTVPDSNALDITGDIEIVVRMSLANWQDTTMFQGIVVKANDPITGGSSQRSYFLRKSNVANVLTFLHTTDGGTLLTQNLPALPAFTANQMVWLRARLDVDNGAGGRTYTLDWATDQPTEPTVWTSLTPTTQTGTTSIWAGTAALAIGSDYITRWLRGRIARVIVRNGIGGPAVLDVSENNAGTMTDPTHFVATTGQTVTVAQTAGNTIVQPQPDRVVWRFDADEYPGTGTTFTDPRGRTWTLSAPGAISPYQPEVPPVWVPRVPGDVCPVQWDRPFDRAHFSTRIILGRDDAHATPQIQRDDLRNQAIFGLEPLERLYLLTRSDFYMGQLADRLLETRNFDNAPKVRAVTLNAATSDDALDLMATVDVYRPSRYRCRLLEPGDTEPIFDAEYLATGVQHELEPGYWTLNLNLDLAAPYAIAGNAGRWDWTGWDLSAWSDIISARDEARTLAARLEQELTPA